ncbi:MAG TPA: NRDE family protein [Candidatus Binatia bacterium]
MCTLALFLNVFDRYPLLVAANRDERYDRPSTAPGLIAADPKIIAGKDLRAGGTWLGINEYGLLVGILNRRANGATLIHANPRSRGLLCMDLLALRSVAEAREFLCRHEENYNPFTVVYVDPEGAGVAFNDKGSITMRGLNAGLLVFSSAAAVDTASGKADRAYGRFLSWASESPAQKQSGDWLGGLKTLLGDHSMLSDNDPRDAICVHGTESGTVSSSIIHYSAMQRRFESCYCAGAPCQNHFAAPLALVIS